MPMHLPERWSVSVAVRPQQLQILNSRGGWSSVQLYQMLNSHVYKPMPIVSASQRGAQRLLSRCCNLC